MKNKKIVIANWKMKLSVFESLALARKIVDKMRDMEDIEIVLSPNFLALPGVGEILKGTPIAMAAQDVFWEMDGAYTGEVSPQLLREAGCSYVIIGHSERRKFLMENYEMIHRKIKKTLEAEVLTPIICIGENWEERKTDRRDFVLFDQIQQALGGIKVADSRRIIVAYEPIWAIGSGTAIEPEEAEYAHKVIKLTLNDMFGLAMVESNFRIIYGGSISAANVAGFSDLAGVDGLLVGGSSLDEEEFFKVSQAIAK